MAAEVIRFDDQIPGGHIETDPLRMAEGAAAQLVNNRVAYFANPADARRQALRFGYLPNTPGQRYTTVTRRHQEELVFRFFEVFDDLLLDDEQLPVPFVYSHRDYVAQGAFLPHTTPDNDGLCLPNTEVTKWASDLTANAVARVDKLVPDIHHTSHEGRDTQYVSGPLVLRLRDGDAPLTDRTSAQKGVVDNAVHNTFEVPFATVLAYGDKAVENYQTAVAKHKNAYASDKRILKRDKRLTREEIICQPIDEIYQELVLDGLLKVISRTMQYRVEPLCLPGSPRGRL